MPRSFHFIEPPNAFAPTSEWVAFLADMRELYKTSPNREVEEAILDAEQELALRREQKPED